jgi:hypothetical protein
MGQISFFKERQRTVHYYDYLIYVCGVDISPYVESLDVTYTDRSGPSSVDITLSNPFDQWILNMGNLAGSFRKTSDRYSEKPKYQIYQKKKLLSKMLTIHNVGSTPPGFFVAAPNPEVDPEILAQAESFDFQQRYSFGPGSCVFSKFDTVKIFMKHPDDPWNVDRWFPAFTGTIDTKPFSTNYVNGRSSLALQAYDLRQTLAGMRVAVNPYQQINSNQNAFFNSDAAGFFKDFYPGGALVRAPGTDNVFAGKSFVDMTSLIVTGRTGWVSPAGGVTSNAADGLPGTPEGSGVGFFQPGQVMKYANGANTSVKESGVKTSLEDWDFLCLFGINSNTNAPYNRFLTQKECAAIGQDSFWGGKHTPMNGQMHFLLPAQGLQISDMIRTSFDGINNMMASPDWTNRFQLLSQVCQQVDYEWSVTGSGDFIFEFPMYDFFPDSFGANSAIYTVNKHLVDDNISDEGGEVIAGLESQTTSANFGKSQVDSAYHTIPPGAAVSSPVRAVTISNVLASRYGAKIANVTFTGIKSKKALDTMTLIEFQKRNADANKLSVNFSFRPFIRPNRPLLHQEKNRIGKTTVVRLSMPNFQQEPHVSTTLGCVRLPLLNNGKIVYQHIAGGYQMSLSYNAIFESPTDLGNSAASGQINKTISSADNQ